MGVKLVPDGGLKKVVNEWKAIKEAWPNDKADQKGWTHQYMQHARTVARLAPITCATIIAVVFPIIITSILLWA
jgi:hypothetical protein